MREALDGEIVLARDSLSALDGEIAWFFRWLERWFFLDCWVRLIRFINLCRLVRLLGSGFASTCYCYYSSSRDYYCFTILLIHHAIFHVTLFNEGRMVRVAHFLLDNTSG